MNKEYRDGKDSEDDIAEVIERPGGYDEDALKEVVGDGSLEDQYDESFDKRGRGWKLAGGAIVITVAGAEYFRRKYGREN